MARTISRRALRRVALGAAAGAVLAAALAIVLVVVPAAQRWFYTVTAQPPSVGTTILVPSDSAAQRALDTMTMDAAEQAATAQLAAQPTAVWLTPEASPLGQVGADVLGLLGEARAQDAALALVVYGLPERDCGNHSVGGLDAADYPTWIDEIAAALATSPDRQKIVVLEPDSLALAAECGNLDERAAQLSGAADALAGPGTWIYLDGGHSGWHSPEVMADFISAVDAGDSIRGFATNVSNYQPTEAEFAYAHALSAELGGLHAIIDTSRNGAASAGGEWCNPPGQSIGEPGGTYGDEVVDTNLWIKVPGESDGLCGGGPRAGSWWPAGAARLVE